MKKVVSLLFTLVTLLGLATSTVSAMSSTRSASGANGAVPVGKAGIDPALVARLKGSAKGSVAISTKKSTAYASFVRAGKNGDLLPANRSRTPQGKALGFFGEYGGLFGIRNPQVELQQIEARKDQYGGTTLTYKQVYNGVPVFGGLLRVQLDAQNSLTSINGVFVPDITLATTPKLSAAQAGKLAIDAVVADPPSDEDGAPARVAAGELTAATTALLVYRTGLVRDATGTNQLVYQVEVTNRSNVRDFVFIHAHSGKIINRYSAITDGLHRVVYEQNTGNKVWEEGQAFPGTLNQDQQNIVTFSGDAYTYFFNAFGRDSYDGAGASLRTVNNDPTIACPNANWNGVTTNYCNGVTADDIVAHEWGHAYTEYTHGLIYQWQSGALNESYSDIWGETVDQLNGKGTDAPNTARTVGSCSTHTRIASIVVINTPASIAGVCAAGSASFGPSLTAAGITGNVVQALDGTDAVDTSTTNGCTALTNASAVAGKIAIIDRGVCAFTIKVKNAQNAGATAVIIADNAPGAPAGMSGADPTITIPSVRISQSNGNLIKTALTTETVNTTLKLDVAQEPQDSYLWLMGEDSSAFGGAIRDMWNPTCLSDPGKVSDAEYFCDSSDAGGVHTNSGVPNHGYALLVNGGTYNGYTISAIGLTKAAHIYWRAQTQYQTPTTDFADHADALEQACQDLIGAPLNTLTTVPGAGGVSSEVINSADCAAVVAMAAAVELRVDPAAQCNFKPVLDANTPALCAGQKNPSVLYTEDFEDGLAGWTLTNKGVFPGWTNTNWAADATLPANRAGTAAYANGTDIGNCDGGAGDVSGAMFLESPRIKVPAANTQAPRLTFDHYVATEAGYDGGNVKISINSGPFVVVPQNAFLFNPYNRTLESAATNTNPLAGQPGFSGTNGGELTGSWGTSQINLLAAGVKPGDTFKVRFDFGRDGCGGNDGWYVDNVQLLACNVKKGS